MKIIYGMGTLYSRLLSAFLYNLKEFEFNFFLKSFSDIFAQSDILYEILQKKN